MTTTSDPRTAVAPVLPDPLRTVAGRRILAALATADPPRAQESRNHRTHRQLRILAGLLPPAGQLLADPDLLTTLSACTAVVDPALYMTVLNHYVLCLGSVVGASRESRRNGPAGAGTGPAAVPEALASAVRKGVFLITEIGDAGSHLAVRTVAEFRPDGREFVLRTPDHRAAKFSSLGMPGMPQSAAVCARLVVDGIDHGVFPFLVDLCDERETAPGVAISGPLRVDELPLEYALVRFDGVRVPYERWLRGSAAIDELRCVHDPLTSDQRLRHTMSVGQALWATLPSAAAVLSRAAAVAALRHSLHRRSHGRLAPGSPVLTYRTQQRALLSALAEAFALTCAAQTAKDLWAFTLDGRTATGTTSGTPPDMAFAPWASVDRRLAAFKALAVTGAAHVTGECQHRCGLAGYLAVNRLSAYHGFARAFDSAGGDNRLILLDIGRALAEEHPDATAPAPPGHPDPDSPTWWPGLVGALERRLAGDLHTTVRTRRTPHLSGMALWNPVLEHARQLGEIHTRRLAAQSVADTLAAVHDPTVRGPLRTLAALYGTTQALRLAGPLQWTGLLGPTQAATLNDTADRQCERLMPHLTTLTEALGTPDDLLPTPLSDPDYAAALGGTLTWHPGAPA
ncbi:acyl-CoA dehydrogenase [Streptomyces sp. CT34]|uniref:acyl-CoA dehydrogenase family protein n=1 Tax=Streptomyces sp. CT34 TaxID=1553907 RepID=UPI00068AA1DB|nr:acyl-CoA dehydrogenase [Streptomyces sp. CT34]